MKEIVDLLIIIITVLAILTLAIIPAAVIVTPLWFFLQLLIGSYIDQKAFVLLIGLYITVIITVIAFIMNKPNKKG